MAGSSSSLSTLSKILDDDVKTMDDVKYLRLKLDEIEKRIENDVISAPYDEGCFVYTVNERESNPEIIGCFKGRVSLKVIYPTDEHRIDVSVIQPSEREEYVSIFGEKLLTPSFLERAKCADTKDEIFLKYKDEIESLWGINPWIRDNVKKEFISWMSVDVFVYYRVCDLERVSGYFS